jgi:phage tail tape-measure protein
MLGAAAGSVLPGIGTAIGAVLGGLVGAFLLGKGKRVTAETQAAEAIELVCAQVEGQAARLLEAQAREALTGLHRQLEGRLETEREHLTRIEDMLQEHASKKDDMKKRVGGALAQVRAMVTDTN